MGDVPHAKFGVKFHQKSEVGVANNLTNVFFFFKLKNSSFGLSLLDLEHKLLLQVTKKKRKKNHD
jgi:hypothetical protein